MSPSSYARIAIFFMMGIFIIFSSLVPSAVSSTTYSVWMERLSTGPILSQAFSAFQFNYNSAYVPLRHPDTNNSVDCLAVRVQNVTAKGMMDVGLVGPSSIAITCGHGTSYPFGPLKYDSVVISPKDSIWQHLAAEDPRVVLVNNPDPTLLMFYTAVNNITDKINRRGNPRAMLALAVCNLTKSPDAKEWKIVGPILWNVKWSKSGALMVRPSPPHILFWGDQSICVAYTNDFYVYNQSSTCILSPRANFFDSVLVESGPPPLKMSDGNYLFLYNSARKYDDPTPKPFGLQYNLGYAILDGSNPTNVLYRSSQPIFSPTLPWEKCDDASGVDGLTPNVVFIEGAKELGPDTWLVYYQGCDSWMGSAILRVNMIR